MPVQLSADLQELFPAGGLPAAQLQTHHQSGPEPGHAAAAPNARHVPRYLRPLSRHVLGTTAVQRFCPAVPLPLLLTALTFSHFKTV